MKIFGGKRATSTFKKKVKNGRVVVIFVIFHSKNTRLAILRIPIFSLFEMSTNLNAPPKCGKGTLGKKLGEEALFQNQKNFPSFLSPVTFVRIVICNMCYVYIMRIHIHSFVFMYCCIRCICTYYMCICACIFMHLYIWVCMSSV